MFGLYKDAKILVKDAQGLVYELDTEVLPILKKAGVDVSNIAVVSVADASRSVWEVAVPSVAKASNSVTERAVPAVEKAGNAAYDLVVKDLAPMIDMGGLALKHTLVVTEALQEHVPVMTESMALHLPALLENGSAAIVNLNELLQTANVTLETTTTTLQTVNGTFEPLKGMVSTTYEYWPIFLVLVLVGLMGFSAGVCGWAVRQWQLVFAKPAAKKNSNSNKGDRLPPLPGKGSKPTPVK